MSNRKIVVVTDSSAYIPRDASKGLDIVVIPLWLLWGNERYQDGIDIDPQTFYRKLRKSKTLPTSSQPSAKEFEVFLRKVADGCDAIVAVLASSKISGTVDSAETAIAHFPEFPIRIVDSLSSSMGLGLVALAAARAAAAGKDIDETVSAAETMKQRAQLLFVVDTLKYLHQGGRIGGAKRFLGTALKIKPILHFENGQIEPLLQARTMSKALDRMLEIVEERLGKRGMAEAAIVDIDNSKLGEVVLEKVRDRFSPPTAFRAEVSPVVGTHVGPGAIGIAFYADG